MITNEDIQGLLNQNSLNQQDAVNAGLLPARLNPAELETLMGSIPKYQVPPEPIKESRGARITEAIRRMGLAFQGIDPNVADLKRQELELRRMQLQQGKDRRIVVQNGIQYYVDTGKPVLTDVVAPPKSGGTMYQIVDGNNNDSFVGNISANDLAAVGFKKYKEQGIDTTAFKLTALPTGAAPADTSGDTDFDALKGRFMATNTLINNLGGLAQNYFDNPKSALAIGGASQFVDSIIQNVDAAGEMLSGKDYTNVQNSGFTTIEGNDFSSELKQVSQATGVSESRVRDLAYLFAATRGQTGRGLSDKDYENALRIVSGGVGAEGKIKVLEDVAVRIGSEVQGDLDFTVRNLPEGTAIDKYTKLRGSLPTFVNPYASSTNKNNDPLEIR
tara:strand:- start:2184 stop:3347 length:1164 start_codon:yes stop_codon:yes gene_type:complete